MGVETILLAGAGAALAGGEAGLGIRAGQKKRRELKRQANQVVANASAQIRSRDAQARDLASTQRAQFLAAGFEVGGTPTEVIEEDLLSTLKENQQIARVAQTQARSLRRQGSAARDTAVIQSGSTLLTKLINTAGSAASAAGG